MNQSRRPRGGIRVAQPLHELGELLLVQPDVPWTRGLPAITGHQRLVVDVGILSRRTREERRGAGSVSSLQIDDPPQIGPVNPQVVPLLVERRTQSNRGAVRVRAGLEPDRISLSSHSKL